MSFPSAPILPPATLGMLGGGQLGRFFVHAAHELGYKVWVLDPDPHSPAGRIADRHFQAAYTDAAARAELAAHCAAVTTEFENVPAETLEALAARVPVRPGAAAVAVCQNRIAEKGFLRARGLPHGPYAEVRTEQDLVSAPDSLFPAVLKVARFGYDGKGQARVSGRTEALAVFRAFEGESCVLERLLPLDCELSVVLARDASGRVVAYPPGENRHRNGILDVTVAPAGVQASLLAQAVDVAQRVAEGLDYVGTLGVEFFVSDGRLVVNEMAPRPHNSGHHTIDACACSQYEQQVRALCNLPLGPTAMHSAAVMVNLLGDLWFPGEGDEVREPDWLVLHRVPGLRLHLYGKESARRGRKMGHFTVIGATPEVTLKAALDARRAIGVERD